MRRNLSYLVISSFVLIALFLAFQTPKDLIESPKATNQIKAEIVAENLDIPWEIGFLPDGELLVTERSGNLLKISKNYEEIKIEGVEHKGEGGLLGFVLHPKFEENNFIYLYMTTKTNLGLINRVERYKLAGYELVNKKIIIDNIPGAAYHDGGRIKFGPDKKLYITTGDATEPELAQDINSLAGKILRLNDDGSIPDDNPFNNEIFSYGHRNPQGITWDDKGELWATEHGRSGVLSGLDELNLVGKGKNYGWPEIEGNQEKEEMEIPIINSGSDNTWAPASAVFANDNIFFAGLRGEGLYQYNIKEKTLKEHFKGEFGRLRAVTLHDNFLYVSTSNRDGRGNEREGDDKIIRISIDSIL